MGYSVVHMQKAKAGGVRGIQSHNQREKPPRTNPDIDNNRTKENYDLLNSRNINYNKAIKERISTFATKTSKVRKDAVVLCNMIVTSDEKTMKAMGAEKQREFFEDSLKFFGDRYGVENIVNATVHMDETTPHMHVGIVPITEDGRLSAKSLFTKSELKILQTEFARQVGECYGLERGVEGSQRKHLSEQRFKTAKALEQEKKALEIASKTVRATERLKDSLEPVKAEYEAKKAFIDQSVKDSEVSMMYPSYATVKKKGIFKKETLVTVPIEKWEEKHVSANQINAIIQSRNALENHIEKLKKNPKYKEIDKLLEKNQDLTQSVDRLRHENRRLSVDLNSIRHEMNSIKDFFERHPDIKKAFAMENSIGKALDMGRSL